MAELPWLQVALRMHVLQRLLAAVTHFLAPAGVFLLAHQTRRAVRLLPAYYAA